MGKEVMTPVDVTCSDIDVRAMYSLSIVGVLTELEMALLSCETESEKRISPSTEPSGTPVAIQ